MALDLTRLSPAALATLLNSSSLGEVATTASVRRQAQAAGVKVGDGKHLNLLRFIAAMVEKRHAEQSADDGKASSYERVKEDAARRSRQKSLSGRDIGALPSIADTVRRRRASRSLRVFCETYGEQVFHLKWSSDHLRVLDRLQSVIMQGGQFALAMPRGSGKTSMVTWATLWAMLTGKRKMVVIIGADARAATQTLDSIRGELETNERICEDFPEACVPLRRLEGIAQRAGGQLCCGKRTMLAMTAEELILPTIAEEGMSHPKVQQVCAGAIVKCVGITGRLRGMQARLASGEVIRPSLVLLDDPQTDESAKSPSQCDDRERLISGAVLGMAGPGETMAALATLTVIRPDDLADRLLTPARHPDWKSERTRLVYEWGDAPDLWEQYATIRRDPERGPDAAREFYIENRDAMDAGTRVAWTERKEAHSVSAIQYAWDLRIDRGEDAFFAEFQNEPRDSRSDDAVSLSVDEVMGRVAQDRRGIVPAKATVLTAGIDVQKDCLYWLVTAWTDDAEGWIVDYGTMPDQPSGLLSLNTIAVPLSTLEPTGTAEAQMTAACLATFRRLMDTDWQVEGGAVMRVDAALIDSGWGLHTETIREACRMSSHRVFPAKGVAIGAKTQRGLNETKKQPGDRVGLHWRSGHPRKHGATIREYRVDVNFWKSWVLARMRTPVGQGGALMLNGATTADMRRHWQLAEQLAAEESISVEAQGRRVDEWRLRRPNLDNHLLDCLVLASVAGSMSGVSVGRAVEEEQETIVLSALQSSRGWR